MSYQLSIQDKIERDISHPNSVVDYYLFYEFTNLLSLSCFLDKHKHIALSTER